MLSDSILERVDICGFGVDSCRNDLNEVLVQEVVWKQYQEIIIMEQIDNGTYLHVGTPQAIHTYLC